MKRVLILTVGYGEGHNAAAHALAAALEDSGKAKPTVLDLFEQTYGGTQELSKAIYLGMINRMPFLWALLYGILDHTPLFKWIIRPCLFALRRKLQSTVETLEPDLIVSTHPVYGQLLDILPSVKIPHYTVVTDSITVNQVWISQTTCGYFIPNPSTARVLQSFGIPSGKLHVTGFPVPLAFTDARPVRAVPFATPDSAPRVLFMVNYDKPRAPHLVEALLGIPNVHLTVTVGRDEALRKAVETVAQRLNKPVEIHGWTREMPQLVMNHHLLIGKAGGAATQEAIAAHTPFIITQVVPGQEMGNAQLITEHGCGAVCSSHAEVASTVQRAFEADATLWKSWEANIKALSTADAARAGARVVLETPDSNPPLDSTKQSA